MPHILTLTTVYTTHNYVMISTSIFAINTLISSKIHWISTVYKNWVFSLLFVHTDTDDYIAQTLHFYIILVGFCIYILLMHYL